MKKRLFAVILALVMALLMCACNYQVVDLTYSYKYAIISLPNGELVEGEVDSWRDYADGDQLQVTVNGTTYLVHAANVALKTD